MGTDDSRAVPALTAAAIAAPSASHRRAKRLPSARRAPLFAGTPIAASRALPASAGIEMISLKQNYRLEVVSSGRLVAGSASFGMATFAAGGVAVASVGFRWGPDREVVRPRKWLPRG